MSGRRIHRFTVWDVAAHAAQVLPDNLLGQEDYISHVSLSPDGRLIAVDASDDKIVVWDVRARRLSAPPIMVDWIYALRFVGPTKLALVEKSQAFDASRGVHVGIWDAKTARLTIGPAAKGPVESRIPSNDPEALISSDGSTVAFSSQTEGREYALLKVAPDLGLSLLPASQDLPERRIGSLDFPNGSFGSIDRAGRRLTYENAAGRSYHDQPQLSPDGRWLVSIVEGRAVIVHDLERAPSGTATPALDASCSLEQEECIRRLCAKVTASIDEKLLNDLLYSSNLQDMKDRLSATCSAGGG